MALILEQHYAQEIIEHARAEVPNECCGLLAGKDGRVVRLYRARNAEASPYRYNVDSHDLLRIFREIDANGWELLGIYHSHTHTPAYPSPTDISLAFYPEAYYILVSLMDAEHPDLRAYRIRNGQVTEETIELVD